MGVSFPIRGSDNGGMTLILVHTAHPQALLHSGPGFGRLVSPGQYSKIRETSEAGITWAADNECFTGLNVANYARMLTRIRHVPGCKFVTAPDVVGDWEATNERFFEWRETLLRIGLPIAYVIQDGQPMEEIPWADIASIFIGGTTDYKLSADAERIGREAKARGLWLHMGRVNSKKRFEYARATGVDSIDGTKFSKFRMTYLPDALEWHKGHLQERIPG